MTSVIRDSNRVTALLAVSNADGETLVPVKANAVTNQLMGEDGVGGTDFSGDDAERDENYVVAFMAVSETDGVTPVPVYADALTGALLIKST